MTTMGLRPEGGNDGLRTGSGLRQGSDYVPLNAFDAGKVLVTEVLDTTTVRVAVDDVNVPDDPTHGAWLEYCVTASPAGVPSTNLDGEIILRISAPGGSGWTTLRHANRAPGRFVYYGLFCRYDNGGSLEWKRMASSTILVPAAHRYGRRLYERLPRWYQDADEQTSERLVSRLMQAFGDQVDVNRTWIETLLDIWDPQHIPAKLLPHLSQLLGLPYERTVGDARVRTLLSNLVYLRKLKGTQEAVEGYVAALSGYRTLVHNGPNLIPTVEDGEFRNGIGAWTAGASTTVTRITSVLAGAPPAGEGLIYIQRTGTTGTAVATLGSSAPNNCSVISPGTGRQLQASWVGRVTTGSRNVTASFIFYNRDGGLVSTVDATASSHSTTFGRKQSGWVSVPDTARYAALRLTAASGAAGTGIEVGRIMVVDRRYRPEGMPGYTNAEPMSEAGSARYTGVDFYDPPRAAWVNCYPQRTNFAVNSDFTLDNLPADGWTIVSAPTYRLLPIAYSTYALAASTEDDYEDLAAGFDSITPTWTINFNTAAGQLEINSSPSAPYVGQVRSKIFPVFPGLSYSAAAEMAQDVAGGSASLRFQWFTLDDDAVPLLDADGVPVVTEGSPFSLGTDAVRVDIRNAVAPEGAGWARLVIEAANPAEHVTYVRRVLIEDNPIPGPYFNGDAGMGAPGDFGYVGTAKQTYSVYYMNFNSIAGSSTNRIITSVVDQVPLHTGRPRITTAYNGLYDLLA